MTLYEQQIEASRRLRMHLYAFTSLRHSCQVAPWSSAEAQKKALEDTRAQVWVDLQEWAALLTQEAQERGGEEDAAGRKE